jgi:competence protein ComEA
MKRSVLIAGLALILASGLAVGLAESGLGASSVSPPLLEQSSNARVNLNRATQMELETLPGIGPKIAREIIKHRPYKNGQELQDKVKGIGPKTWADLKNRVTFGR